MQKMAVGHLSEPSSDWQDHVKSLIGQVPTIADSLAIKQWEKDKRSYDDIMSKWQFPDGNAPNSNQVEFASWEANG